MKYPIYKFLVGWTVSGILGFIGLYLIDPFLPVAFNHWQVWIGAFFIKMSLDSMQEITTTKDE